MHLLLTGTVGPTALLNTHVQIGVPIPSMEKFGRQKCAGYKVDPKLFKYELCPLKLHTNWVLTVQIIYKLVLKSAKRKVMQVMLFAYSILSLRRYFFS